MITSASADAFGHVVADAHAHLLEVARHQRLRPDGADLGHAERRQRVDVGARDARVDDVADDRHRQVAEVLLVVADRVHVEQPLRRVRVAAVAGVDDVHVRRAVLRDQVRRAALRVAHDEHVGVHRRQVGDRCRAGSRPWPCDERAMSRLMTSADSRLAAISKVVRVRVEFSKNRLKTLLPRSSGTFLTSRSLTLRKVPAVSRMCVRIDARQALDRQQMDQLVVAVELRVAADEHERPRRQRISKLKRPSSSRASDSRCPAGSSMRRRRAGGADRQLAAAAVDQHRQRDARRPAEVEQLVDRRRGWSGRCRARRRRGRCGGPRPRTAAWSWSAPADRPRSREVVAVQRARDHAGRAGAGRGRAAAARRARRRPTRCRPAPPSGLSRPRTPAQQLGVERFGVELASVVARRSARAGTARG